MTQARVVTRLSPTGQREGWRVVQTYGVVPQCGVCEADFEQAAVALLHPETSRMECLPCGLRDRLIDQEVVH